MSRSTVARILIWVLVLGSAVSCSKFRKIQKSDDTEVKYRAAMEYYNNGDYYRASVLFESILPLMRGRPEAEKIQFYFAYAYFYQKQYILSAHYFKTFFQIYARSDLAEEAMYMHAYSLYLDSPPYDLDQSSTNEAIQAMQVFLNKYPGSSYRQKASNFIDEMRLKLEKKAYENAIQYYRLEKYNGGDALKAALIAFENFHDQFPDSHFNEDIGFLKIECAYKLAKRSIRSKQQERLLSTIEYYEEFIDNFPQSERVKDAEGIYIDARNDLDKLKKENS